PDADVVPVGRPVPGFGGVERPAMGDAAEPADVRACRTASGAVLASRSSDLRGWRREAGAGDQPGGQRDFRGGDVPVGGADRNGAGSSGLALIAMTGDRWFDIHE